MNVRACVLAGFGLNCDVETAEVLRLAGAEADQVHISQLTGTTNAPPTHSLEDYQILVFDGGFSWADDHGAGVLLATRVGRHLGDQLREMIARGGLVIGICNGFQALVNLGLLPMLNGSWERSVALADNDCGNFQNRWVELLVEPDTKCIFTQGLDKIDMPVRHGEGKLVTDAETLTRLEDEGLVALRYGRNGKPADGRWPYNPNGALGDIAGICDPSGRVFGLMPHPEGHYRVSQHPDWTLERERARRKGRRLDPHGPGAGLVIFQNAVAAASQEGT